MKKYPHHYSPRGAKTMTWDSFVYDYFDTGWFDHEDRPKTVAALRRLVEQVPDGILDDLSVTLFAPTPFDYGRLLPGTLHTQAFIYLAPNLETQPQEEVDFTVAHEFAHAHLGQEQSVRNIDTIEDEADALVVTWGIHRASAKIEKDSF
jgi:hypothetical protein